MATGRIRLLATLPGARHLQPLVRQFCGKGGGVITALNDSALLALRSVVPEEASTEVLLFGQLVMNVGSLLDETPATLAQGSTYLAAIAAASESLTDDTPLSKSKRFTGFHEALTKTLKELADWGIGPDELDEVASRAEGELQRKLGALAFVHRGSMHTLHQLGRQLAFEQLRLCLSQEPTSATPFSEVLVYVGAELEPLALLWLNWLRAGGVNVTLITHRHPGSSEMFSVCRELEEFFGTTAEWVGDGNGLLQCLFTNEVRTDALPAVTVMSAADPLAECEWILREVLKAHREGTPLNSIGILARDIEGYAPLLESAAKRLGVPLKLSRRAPLLTNSFARLTLQALEFAASSDVRSILPLARSSYLGLSRADRQEFESAIREAHRMRALQWKELYQWALGKGDSYRWLTELLTWREKAIAEPATLAAWAGKLIELRDALPWRDVRGHDTQRDLRAWTALHRILASHASVQRVLGEQLLNVKSFARLAREVWEAGDFSLPTPESGVTVAPEPGGLGAVRVLFVAGMLEGVFPRRRSEDPVLTDEDRAELSRLQGLGVPLRNSFDKARAERDAFYSVCALASDQLVLSYPQTDEQRDNIPAFYLEEVKRAAGTHAEVDRPRMQLAPEPEECFAPGDALLRAALESDPLEPLPLQLELTETMFRLRSEDDGGFTPSEIRSAHQCPFSFFARHVLKLRSDRSRARWSMLRRLPQAARLAEQPSPEHARSALAGALEVQLDEIYSEVPEWELSLLKSGGTRLIDEWVNREFVARKKWGKDPGSVKTEARFGEAGLRKELGKFGELQGRVPAVSRMGDYTVVHLVESSPPIPEKASPTGLSDRDTLYYGLHLLAAYEKSGGTALEVETMSGERILMLLPRLPLPEIHGQVQDGLKVVDLSPHEDPTLAKKLFYEEVKKQLGEAVSHIRSVHVHAVRGDHCSWCDYGELCRRSLEFGEEDSPFGDDIVFGEPDSD